MVIKINIIINNSYWIVINGYYVVIKWLLIVIRLISKTCDVGSVAKLFAKHMKVR